MNSKVIFIASKFKPLYKEVTRHVDTGETKKGLLGFNKKVYNKEKQLVQEGESDCVVSGHDLQEDINEAIQKLSNEGYEVVNITPVTSGQYNYEYKFDPGHGIRMASTATAYGYGYGYGYSYTSGVLLYAKKV